MHAAGKTDQAKADLARLAKIRKEREEAQAKRKAEQEGGWPLTEYACMMTIANLVCWSHSESCGVASKERRAGQKAYLDVYGTYLYNESVISIIFDLIVSSSV